MLLKKEGYPEEGELALCTVTKIHFHSVFVNLDEWGKGGMIHISEISPGRIRNLRDYVVEGKVIVCKVLRISRDKGHIDLSLRRVTEGQRRRKISDLKKQQKVEKIIEFVAKNLKKDVNKFYKELNEKVQIHYDTIHDCFEDAVAEEFDLKDLGLEAELTKELDEVVKQRIKPKEVEIKGYFIIKSYAADGVEVVKKTLLRALEKANDKTTLKYSGAGKFKVIIKDSNYKDAEKTLEKMKKASLGFIEKNDGEGSFERIEA